MIKKCSEIFTVSHAEVVVGTYASRRVQCMRLDAGLIPLQRSLQGIGLCAASGCTSIPPYLHISKHTTNSKSIRTHQPTTAFQPLPAELIGCGARTFSCSYVADYCLKFQKKPDRSWTTVACQQISKPQQTRPQTQQIQPFHFEVAGTTRMLELLNDIMLLHDHHIPPGFFC